MTENELQVNLSSSNIEYDGPILEWMIEVDMSPTILGRQRTFMSRTDFEYGENNPSIYKTFHGPDLSMIDIYAIWNITFDTIEDKIMFMLRWNGTIENV